MYANVVDLSQLPKPIRWIMADWFDENDTIAGKNIDDIYVRIKGENEEQIMSRAELLQKDSHIRNGGGCRIWKNPRKGKRI